MVVHVHKHKKTIDNNNFAPNAVGKRPRLGIEMVPDQYFQEEAERQRFECEKQVLLLPMWLMVVQHNMQEFCQMT